jgi:hypothetical protein
MHARAGVRQGEKERGREREGGTLTHRGPHAASDTAAAVGPAVADTHAARDVTFVALARVALDAAHSDGGVQRCQAEEEKKESGSAAHRGCRERSGGREYRCTGRVFDPF